LDASSSRYVWKYYNITDGPLPVRQRVAECANKPGSKQPAHSWNAPMFQKGNFPTQEARGTFEIGVAGKTKKTPGQSHCIRIAFEKYLFVS
jgi:hypothetical protein